MERKQQLQGINLVDIEAKGYLLGVTLITRRTIHYLVIQGIDAEISRGMVTVCCFSIMRYYEGMTVVRPRSSLLTTLIVNLL